MSEDKPDFEWVALGGGMLDQIRCQCGWESATFFDGDVYAHSQWKRHVEAGHEDVPVHSFTRS